MRSVLLSCVAALTSLSVAGPGRGADEEAVQNAIKRGVKYLQFMHQPRQGYNGGMHGMGTACLCGLAMLEGGAPEDDPAIVNITKFVRENALSLTKTYEISLAIIYLDRLGNKADIPFIQFLGIRLLGAQAPGGGWNYSCDVGLLSPQEQNRLKESFQDSRLTGGTRASPSDSDPPVKPAPKSKQREDLPVDPKAPKREPKANPPKNDAPAASKADPKPALHPDVIKWSKMINNQGGVHVFGPSDNSNTQFAILGAWCARRHGVSADRAIEVLGKRFRVSQGAQGGWAYLTPNDGPGPGGINFVATPTAAMTCAGLIGLAASLSLNQQGNRAHREAIDDPVVKRGLKCLGDFLANKVGIQGQPMGVPGPMGLGNNQFQGMGLTADLYFLWSLERVGVIYGLDTIGNTDWYDWGARPLLASQMQNGSWNGNGMSAGGEIGTSFAVLFLCKANIAKDMTAKLKGRVNDPGLSKLKGGSANSTTPKPTKKGSGSESPKDSATNNAPKVEPPIAVVPPASVNGEDFDKEANRLSTALVAASAGDRPAILAQFRDSKGGVYTEALARSIAKLTGEAQQETRTALAKRLTRMTANTLREMLKDANRDLRCAAATACAYKNDRQFVPDLIAVLSDSDSLVVQAARATLKSLSGKDFGPLPEADKNDAIRAWKEWWSTQAK